MTTTTTTTTLTAADLADDTTARALVATIKAAVNGAAKYDAFVAAHHVTRENVSEWAQGLATLAYPNERPVQRVDGKRTKYGNAVQAAATGLRRALGKDESDGSDTEPNLLTREGKQADLDAVIAAWHAAQQ